MQRNVSHSFPRNWKRIATLGLSTLALGLTTLAASAPAWSQGISVSVDGRAVDFGAAPPVSRGGRVLVPLRGVFEALGATVDYNAATRTIDAARGETRLQLTLGSRTAFVNGAPVTLDVPAQTQVGRTFVPLRFVGEAFGATVNYDPNTRSIFISSPGDVDPLPTPTPTPTPDPTDDGGETAETISGPVVKVDTTAPATITVRSEGRNQTFEIARNAIIERRPMMSSSTAADPRYGTTTRHELAAIRTGESVQLTLDDANRAVRVTAMPQVFSARIRSATGNRIVLDDARNTTLTIGPNVRFINTQGRAVTTANLRAGDEVVLFISPDTRYIYQVSASPVDINAAAGRPVDDVYLPPDGGDDGGNPPAGDAPEIQQVSHNATAALRTGSRIVVTVRGTPGLQGTIDLSPRATNIPLREATNRPGEYRATYTVRANDDVLNGRITARLTDREGRETIEQSQDELTIDTTPPRVEDTDPRDRETVDVAQPNITIIADDLGGSGLAPSTITITNAGQTFDVPATVTRRGLRAVSPRGLSGRVDVSAEVRDEAGNSTTETFSFTVRGNGVDDGGEDGLGPIRSIFHNANRALQIGDVVTVDMTAEPGGRASFDLVGANNRTIAAGITMTEINADQGRYRGTYTLRARDVEDGDLRVVGRFRDANNRLTTREATTTIEIVGGEEVGEVTITSPTEGQQITTQLVVQGTGTPGAIVDVSVTALGTQFYIFEYKEELGAQQVRVNRNGRWQTATINLPRPRNVSGIRYTISATQTDAANRTSEPVTVTVRPQ